MAIDGDERGSEMPRRRNGPLVVAVMAAVILAVVMWVVVANWPG